MRGVDQSVELTDRGAEVGQRGHAIVCKYMILLVT
jgi:hypothetical protein